MKRGKKRREKEWQKIFPFSCPGLFVLVYLLSSIAELEGKKGRRRNTVLLFRSIFGFGPALWQFRNRCRFLEGGEKGGEKKGGEGRSTRCRSQLPLRPRSPVLPNGIFIEIERGKGGERGGTRNTGARLYLRTNAGQIFGDFSGKSCRKGGREGERREGEEGERNGNSASG